MQSLIDVLRTKCAELGAAVERGDDQHVKVLDKELMPLLDAVFRADPFSKDELFDRLRMGCELVRQGSLDALYVRERIGEIIGILDGAFEESVEGLSHEAEAKPRRPKDDEPDSCSDLDARFLQALVDQLQDQVLVISSDLRVLFANRAFLKANPYRRFGHVGLHTAEIADGGLVGATQRVFSDWQVLGYNRNSLYRHGSFSFKPFPMSTGGGVDAVLVTIRQPTYAAVLPYKATARY